MQKTIWIILFVFLVSCEKECNEDFGAIIQKEISLPLFDEIIVNSGIEMVIKQDVTQQVIVETGENRFDNVHINVTNNVLELQADSSCSLNPSLPAVKVYINCPDIKSIRNSSEYTIASDGVLTYPSLQLISEDYDSDYLNFGDFDLEVNNNSINVISNGLSITRVSGATTSLGLYYYSGIGKFEGRDLLAEHINLFHRADNNLRVNPQQSLTGDILSTGDVISYNHPPVVEVSEHFMGRLIFE